MSLNGLAKFDPRISTAEATAAFEKFGQAMQKLGETLTVNATAMLSGTLDAAATITDPGQRSRLLDTPEPEAPSEPVRRGISFDD
jgi:hypothetical protein